MNVLSISDLDAAFGKMLQKFPEARKKQMEASGEKMYNQVIQNIESSTTEKTGDLKKGVRKVIGTHGENAVVQPSREIATYTYLVENGYPIIRNGKAVGWANGKFMYRNALTKLKAELIQDSVEMAEGLVKDCFG